MAKKSVSKRRTKKLETLSSDEDQILRRHVRTHVECALGTLRVALEPLKKRESYTRSPVAIAIRKAIGSLKRAEAEAEEFASSLAPVVHVDPIKSTKRARRESRKPLPGESIEEAERRRRRERRAARKARAAAST